MPSMFRCKNVALVIKNAIIEINLLFFFNTLQFTEAIYVIFNKIMLYRYRIILFVGFFL